MMVTSFEACFCLIIPTLLELFGGNYLAFGFSTTTAAAAAAYQDDRIILELNKNDKNLLPQPPSRLVNLQFFNNHIDTNTEQTRNYDFEQYQRQRQLTWKYPFQLSTLLKRQDNIDLYGRVITHQDDEANYATLTISHSLLTDSLKENDDNNSYNWDATMLLTPSKGEGLAPQNTCFVAMNRFAVKEDCRLLFEQRWMERESKLSHQPGFIAFSLLRKRQQEQQQQSKINYSTCTIWSSKDHWMEWRNGQGKYSHDAARKGGKRRTPVSEWLEEPASPIFWSGLNTIVAKAGV